MTEARTAVAGSILLSVLVVLPALVPAATAADGKARTGFFLGVLGVQTGLGGDMNGRSSFAAGPETFLVPEVKAASGYGLCLGRREETFSQEIGYYQIEHDAMWRDAACKATSRWVEYIPRFYLATRSALQPFASLGLSYMWMDAEDCARSESKAGVATFYGLGLNLSGGLSIYLHPRLSLQGSGGYRILMVGRVKGPSGKAATIQETVWADGPTFSGGLTLTF